MCCELSFLNQTEILEIIFPIAYSFYKEDSPSKANIHYIEVEPKIRIGCGFWVKEKSYPSILYFGGNGETVGDYDEIALFYNKIGINFFMADYRGYGMSNGKPTVFNTLNDSHIIFKEFKKIIKKDFNSNIFIMGRSLGSMPALEIVFHHQNDVSGLIIESGRANNLRKIWCYLKASEREILLDEKNCLLNEMKIKQIKKPTLIIHGQMDNMVDPEEGKKLFENSGAEDKEIFIIPHADHNTIIGMDKYFPKIEEFVKKHS